jgi:hypothetical protein
MALLALPHGHARAVPEPLLGLRLFVVIVSARAQRGAQRVLVVRQPLLSTRRDGQNSPTVDAVTAISRVAHTLQGALHGLLVQATGYHIAGSGDVWLGVSGHG